jgi:predicted XRE-type DNA-binding protein
MKNSRRSLNLLSAAFMRVSRSLPSEPLSQAESARRLGVTRFHLNRVLRGHIVSRSLTSRYQALQEEARK